MKNVSAYFENALTFFLYYAQLYSPKRVSAKFIPIFFANRIRHYLYVRPHHLYFLTKSRREDLTKINIYARKQASRKNLSAKEIRTSLDTEEKCNERERTEAYRANHIYQSKRNAKKKF